jgi:probable HAF family extracellular repeat protein
MNSLRSRLHPNGLAAALLVFTLASTSALATASPAFQGLGRLPGLLTSRANAISSDGLTIAGAGYTPNGAQMGFRWTAANGLEQVSSGLPQTTIAYALSGDGQVIGGYAESIIDAKAYVWTSAAGPTLLFARGSLYSASSDGAVMAGDEMDGGTHQRHAVRWTAANGMKIIEPKGVVLGESRAFGINATGDLVVGEAVFPNYPNQRAFLWDAANGMVNIGSTDFGAGFSRADAISADGGVVVGTVQPGSSGPSLAFRWTAAGGTQWLTGLPTTVSSEAYAVSADGRVIVGTHDGDAFVWRADVGMVSLRGVLGADANGWRLVEAKAISADGSVVAGWGYNPQGQIEAWRAEVPAIIVTGVAPANSGHVALSVHTYPNPARGTVFVRANSSDPGAADATVLDLAGRVVRVLAPSAAGSAIREWAWDGRSNDGRNVPAGVYLVRVRVGGETRVGRIMRVE